MLISKPGVRVTGVRSARQSKLAKQANVFNLIESNFFYMRKKFFSIHTGWIEFQRNFWAQLWWEPQQVDRFKTIATQKTFCFHWLATKINSNEIVAQLVAFDRMQTKCLSIVQMADGFFGFIFTVCQLWMTKSVDASFSLFGQRCEKIDTGAKAGCAWTRTARPHRTTQTERKGKGNKKMLRAEIVLLRKMRSNVCTHAHSRQPRHPHCRLRKTKTIGGKFIAGIGEVNNKSGARRQRMSDR